MTQTPSVRMWQPAAGLLACVLAAGGCRKADAPAADPPVPAIASEATAPSPAPKAPGPAKADPFAPLVEVQDEDYARVRTRFRTKLTRQGPSPQTGDPVKPPEGVTEVQYPSGELRLTAWVNPPVDPARRHPAVLFLHGGFAFGADDWDESRPFRDAGYVVLTPILRGENGQPGAYSFFYDEVDDVLAAADYLGKLPYVDPGHLYIAGPSAGGTLVLLAAMTTDRFRAAASFSAMTDQVLLCKHAKHAARDVPTDITDLRELEVRSPLAYAASLKCPARLYYGSQEPDLRPMTVRTAQVARGRGRDAEAVQVEGDHSTSVPSAVRQALEFFRKN